MRGRAGRWPVADDTHIEWTDATWNPVTGCSVVSPGCTNCYAMKLAGTRLQHHPSRAGLTQETKAGPVWTGEVRLNEGWLDQPLRWRRARRIFVCAHGDLFHESVPDEWIDRVFAVMALCPQHTFQVLTKRADRMRAYLTGDRSELRAAITVNSLRLGLGDPRPVRLPLPNVWLGVSVEDQQRANERIPDLLATPAAVRFLSCEPLLGPVDLTWIEFPNERGRMECYDALDLHMDQGDGPLPEGDCSAVVDWVICGGESGPGARPMHPDWARSLRDQCTAARVPFFHKQNGAWAPLQAGDGYWPTDSGGCIRLNPEGMRADDGWPMQLVGKKHAGRLLDGVEHNGMPA